MATMTIDKRAVKTRLDSDDRNITTLWNLAIKEYTGTTGITLVEPHFKSSDEMVAFGTKEIIDFHKIRHDGSKIDKLRSLFMQNIDFVQKGSTMILNAAAATFPPAAAINTAMTYVLSACKAVSAQYDAIINFFEDLNIFLKRVTIIEKRVPTQKAYQNTLLDVFASFLNMCGIAHKVIKNGRFKTWVMTMLGDNPDLAGGRQKMTDALKRLEDAGQFANIDNTEHLLDEQSSMKDRLADYQMELIRNDQVQIRLAESQKILLQEVSEEVQGFRDETRENFRKLMHFFESVGGTGKAEIVQNTTGETTSTNNPFRARIEKKVQDVAPTLSELEQAHIKGAGMWLFNSQEWKAWLLPSSTSVNLSLQADVEMGKSHIAFAAYEMLRQYMEPGAEVVTVYFALSKVDLKLRTFDTVLCSLLVQMADQNLKLRENAKAWFSDENNDIEFVKGLRNNYIYETFCKDSTFRLYVVIDDLDCFADYYEAERFQKFMDEIRQREMSVKIFSTTTCASNAQAAKTVQIGREDFLMDLRIIVCARLLDKDPAFDGIRNTRLTIKQMLAQKIERTADNFLHVEQSLLYLGGIRREGAVVQAIQTLPENILALYERTLTKCQLPLPVEALKNFRRVISWISFSCETLTIKEVNEIGKLGDFEITAADILDNFPAFFETDQSTETSTVDASIDVKSIFAENASLTIGAVVDDQLLVRLRHQSMKKFFGTARPSSILCGSVTEGNFLILSDIIQMIADGPLLGSMAHHAYDLFYYWLEIDFTELNMYQRAFLYQALYDLLDNVDFMNSLVYGINDYQRERLLLFAADEKLGTMFRQWSSGAVDLSLREDVLKYWSDPAMLIAGFMLSLVRTFELAPDAAFALDAFKLISEFLDTFGEPGFKGGWDHIEDDGSLNTYESVMNVVAWGPDDFGENHNANYAIGVVLNKCGSVDKAIDAFLKAVNLCDDNFRKAHYSLELSTLYSMNGDYEESLNYCDSAWNLIEQTTIPDPKLMQPNDTENNEHQAESDVHKMFRDSAVIRKLKCDILQTRSEFQYGEMRFSDAINTLAQARHIANHTFATDLLYYEILYCEDRGTSPLDVLSDFAPVHRLQIMTDPRFRSDMNLLLARQLATKCKRFDKTDKTYAIVDTIYREVIAALDLQRAASPLRLQYAQTLWSLRTQIAETKVLLDQVLDSIPESFRYTMTNETALHTACLALNLMTRLLQDEFCNSKNGLEKQQVYLYAKDLHVRGLILATGFTSSDAIPSQLVQAAMLLKIGPIIEYERLMRRIFDSIMRNLRDKLDINDHLNLWYLARLLTMEPALPAYSEIVHSMMYSQLQPQENSTEEYDKAYLMRPCDGICVPSHWVGSWTGAMYQCLSCPQSWLCSDCYEIRTKMNHQTDARKVTEPQFCCANNTYLVGPMKGWRGVKNGVVIFEDSESKSGPMKRIPVEQLFQDISTSWDKAWEQYWLKH